MNWTLCEDPENTTLVLTANGEVHTNEEAQENVHDLDLFVTVQLLEDALAVLSLGKLCEDHGCSYDWVSGQKPRWTKEGKTMKCKTNNFRTSCCPWIVKFWYKFVLYMAIAGLVKYIIKYIFKSSVLERRGLSTSSGSNSSTTSTSQDLSPTCPAQERRDGLAPGDWSASPSKTQNENKKRDGNRDSDDRLRGLS